MTQQPPPTSFTDLPFAGVGKRLAALLYDLLILAGLLMVYGFLAMMVTSVFGGLECRPDQLDYNPCVSGPLLQVGMVLVVAGYYVWSWRGAGQTIGMRAWRLMVASPEGVQLSWKQCAIRALVAPVSLAMFGAGYFWGLTRKDRASWHDLASDSQVRQLPKRGKK
ncbi:hypothetical protein Maes01_01510 [Microbulbifer aestuariivivens]|uniref:RDD domain-containing protein n=1 Tax=Microbulbifer aestuariivivens TaxID=1908308 RepID=A0ABP9WRU4_9GAMM